MRFTNGLTVYLTGDTGMFADMEHVIAKTLPAKSRGDQHRPWRQRSELALGRTTASV